MEFFFFMLFGLVLIGMYIAIRRQIAPIAYIAAGGVSASIISMVLFMLARDTSALQSLVMGILVGALFAGATLAIAWYFQSNELREHLAGQGAGNSQPDSVEEYYDSAS